MVKERWSEPERERESSLKIFRIRVINESVFNTFQMAEQWGGLRNDEIFKPFEPPVGSGMFTKSCRIFSKEMVAAA